MSWTQVFFCSWLACLHDLREEKAIISTQELIGLKYLINLSQYVNNEKRN